MTSKKQLPEAPPRKHGGQTVRKWIVRQYLERIGCLEDGSRKKNGGAVIPMRNMEAITVRCTLPGSAAGELGRHIVKQPEQIDF
jgi:hypothetical protein